MTESAEVAAPSVYEYVVKFLCGHSPGEVTARGVYFTAINVHNPGHEPVHLRWKVAVALPGLEPGPVSKFSTAELGPDEALEIDCADLRCPMRRRDPFLKGFVVIQSVKADLDVVAVYTAAGADDHVETLFIERVRPRSGSIRQGLPDLIPVPDPAAGFCRRDPQGRLIVTVKNQGNGDAGASTTEIDFVPGGTVSVPTPPIPAGQSVDLAPVDIPPECFRPGHCTFRITVDAQHHVDESNEANNTASGTCPG
jgi:CARDB